MGVNDRNLDNPTECGHQTSLLPDVLLGPVPRETIKAITFGVRENEHTGRGGAEHFANLFFPPSAEGVGRILLGVSRTLLVILPIGIQSGEY